MSGKMENWTPQMWAAIVAVVGALVGWAGKRSTNTADAASTLTDGALKIVNELQEELGGLRTRMAAIERDQRNERIWCDMRIDQLVKALRDEGIDVPMPPPRHTPLS